MTPGNWDSIIREAGGVLVAVVGVIVAVIGARSGKPANDAARQTAEGVSPTEQLLRTVAETMRRVERLEDRVTMLEAELAIAIQFIRELVTRLVTAGLDIPIVPETLRRHLTDLIRGHEE